MRFKKGQELRIIPKVKVVRYTRAGLVLCKVNGRYISLPESDLITDKHITLMAR